MTTETLFDPNSVPEIPTADPNKDYHAELVGEGKKFKDDKALAYSNVEKDTFILRLQNENKQMRDELTRINGELKTRTSLDEFLQKVKETQTGQQVRSTPDNQATETVLNEEKISEIIESRLTAKERQTQEANNVRMVQEGLTKAFGPDYVSALVKKANDLGVDKSFLDNLAKTAPRAFFAALGINPEQQTRTIFNAPNSTLSSAGSNSGPVKNESYYNDLRKKLPPAEYWSPSVQNEKFEQAKKLGDAFYNS